MAFEEDILSEQLKIDAFHNEDGKVSGIAKLAVDKGWASLSALQQRVLEPFLSKPCEGVTDPGGHHNGCEVVLTDAELRDAYHEMVNHDALLCENCRDEANDIAAHRERFFRD